MLTTLSLAACLLIGEGLVVSPPPGSEISRDLRTSPDSSSLVLKHLIETDKLHFLRSEGDWYEVEASSLEGFNFRGWVKVTDKRPPPPPVSAPYKAKVESPLQSNRYLWFWSGRLSEKASVSFGVGAQDIEYLLEGTYSSGTKAGTRGTIYSFSAPGLTLNLALGFSLLEFSIGNGRAQWRLDADYNYGLSSVSFGSAFAVPELQGASYKVSTHLYDVKTLFDYRWANSPHFEFSTAAGLGYLLFEVLPDLKPVQGGTFDGELIVGDIAFHGVGLPLQIKTKAFRKWTLFLSATPYLFLTDISEDVLNSSGYSADGLPPFLLRMNLDYEFHPGWSVLIDGRYLKFSGSSSGSATRLKNAYTDGSATVSSYQGFAGLGWRF